MICLICGNPIGQEMPIPVAEIRFTPIVPHVPGITDSRKADRIIRDAFCCQKCYKAILDNDFAAIQEIKLPQGN